MMRETHQLEYFAHSEWVDPPARMLAPLLVAAVESTGTFRAVVLTPSAAVGDLRLDTEIVRLQHEFQTSQAACVSRSAPTLLTTRRAACLPGASSMLPFPLRATTLTEEWWRPTVRCRPY